MNLAGILRHWRLFGVVASLVGGLFYLVQNGPVSAFQRQWFDFLKANRSQIVVVDDPAGSKIALVGVEDETYTIHGSPLPRALFAGAIRNLFEDGAKIIAIDMKFEAADRTPDIAREVVERISATLPSHADEIRKAYTGIENKFDHDEDLALVLEEYRDRITAVFYSPFEGPENRANFGDLPESWKLDARGCSNLDQPKSLVMSTTRIRESISFGGNAVVEADGIDGKARKYRLVQRIGPPDCDSCVYPSLGFSAALLYLEAYPTIDCEFGDIAHIDLQGFGENPFSLPRWAYDLKGNVELDFLGTFEESFANTIPIHEVAAGKFPKGRFKDKLVFIGPLSDFEDTVSTPVGRYNGVGLHALVAHSFLTNTWLRRDPYVVTIEILTTLAIGTLVTIIFYVFETSNTPLVGAFLLLPAGVIGSKLLVEKTGIAADALTPSLVGMVAILGCLAARYLVERETREKSERELGRFVSGSVKTMVLKNPDLVLPARREITIMFSDIRGFTTTAEKMPPEELVKLLKEYLTRMTDIVDAHNGTLDKYIGDAVMAIFGAPATFDNHAELACRTALEMIRELKVLQADWRARNLPVLEIGVGVNTGIASVGRMGSERRSEYTCIGDEVNFASRVEGLTKPYGVKILVGENTRSAVGDRFVFRDLGKVKVKGKTKAVRIYELLGTREELPVDPAWIKIFESGMEAFQARNWDEADELFKKATELRGGEDPPSAALMMWTGIFRKRPPEAEWDGTIERREK